MSSAFFGIQIEDNDGDLIEIGGDSRDGLVSVTLNFDPDELDLSDSEGIYSEITPTDARTLAAALVMAAGQAEGNGIGL